MFFQRFLRACKDAHIRWTYYHNAISERQDKEAILDVLPLVITLEEGQSPNDNARVVIIPRIIFTWQKYWWSEVNFGRQKSEPKSGIVPKTPEYESARYPLSHEAGWLVGWSFLGPFSDYSQKRFLRIKLASFSRPLEPPTKFKQKSRILFQKLWK